MNNGTLDKGSGSIADFRAVPLPGFPLGKELSAGKPLPLIHV